jgi:hypothetical protein
MTLTDVGTPASTDRVLLQDASDSNNLKYADFSEFGGGGSVRTVTAGGNTLGASETLAFTAGTGISISEAAGAVTITNTVTDTNTFRTVTAGGNTLGASETLAFTAGTNVSISESAGAVTIASTDTDTTDAAVDVYAPANLAHWAAPPPATVADALNRIAAHLNNPVYTPGPIP